MGKAVQEEASADTRRGSQTAWYVAFFAIQTAGIAIILWQGVPLLRLILNDPGPQHAQTEHFLWGIVGIALVQGAYWLRLVFVNMPPVKRHILLGHLVLLAARLSFVFGGAVFGAVFYIRAPQLSFTAWRVALLVAILFSVFCYTRELERLGHVLEQRPSE